MYKRQPLFRLAETFLIRAEAYGRKGNFSASVLDINKVRARAAFKAGETRNEVLARLYPGSENLAKTCLLYTSSYIIKYRTIVFHAMANTIFYFFYFDTYIITMLCKCFSCRII